MFGGSSGGSSGLVSFEFSDKAVTSLIFERGNKISYQKFLNNLDNFFSSTAFADGGPVVETITCTIPEPVSFEMMIFGKAINIEANCSANLEHELRAKMLKAMAGEVILIDYAGGSSQSGREIDLRAMTDLPYTAKDVFANGSNELCRDKYEFRTDGKVIISLDVDATKNKADDFSNGNYPIAVSGENFLSADEVVEHCVAGDGGLDAYTIDLAFRFKDGYLEIDADGNDFSDNYDASLESHKKLLDFNRWCVDDGHGECDLGGSLHVELPEVCHQEDSENSNCPSGSIDPWK